MAIRDIHTVADYRAFKAWKPHSPLEFHEVNVVYGSNGSGKSTLAAMLREAAAGSSTSGCSLHVELDDRPQAGPP